MQSKLFVKLAILIFFIWNAVSQAGITGKISGQVVDAESGNPLPGVNIMIEGTTLGAATDIQGNYYVINVPPGIYSVKASMIGYETMTQTNVQVSSDITTRVSFRLKQTILEGQEVTIVAERPPIQKDLTSSLQTFGDHDIQSAPIDNLPQLLEIQAGVSPIELTERAGVIRDAPGDGLHIRGGRENETVFLVDGVRVDNPIWGGAGYAQNSSGTTINEISTILGTFNAEYGGKMSGVINLVTKEGKENYSGRVSGYTDNFGIKAYDRNTFQGEYSFSGPMPFYKNLTFYSNAQIRSTDGRFYAYIIPGWTDSKGKLPLEDENGNPLGKKVSADWKDEWHTLQKLTWKVTPALKIMTDFVMSSVRKVKYYHAYKYLPYGMPWSDTKELDLTLKITHQLNPKTFYDLTASYQRIDYWMGVDKTREQRIVMGSRLSEPTYGFYYSGARNDFWADTTNTYQLNFNITSQVTPLHLLKGGINLRYMDLFHRLDLAWDTPVDQIVKGANEQGELIKETFESHKAYSDSRPIEWAAFLQDKMEFESLGMILNLGFRWERWSIGERYMEDPERPMETPLRPTNPKNRFSPRLGISFPISEKAAFHFAYGHFYQFPSYVDLLSGINEKGQYPDRPNLQDVGLAIFNPNIRPEKSVTYEAGVQTQLMENVSLNVTAYYRELADLVGVTWIQTAGYVYFDNVDFGNSKGLELTLDKRFSNSFSARINYTLSQTLISTSSPLTAAQTVSTAPIAYRSFLANWDRTHDLSALVLVSKPRNWAISLKSAIKSGRPYTVMAEQKNTERMPWYMNFDLRMNKYFRFFDLKETIFLKIYNLLNRRNINYVYSVTGKWNDDGDPGTPYAHDANPRYISDRRRVQIGFRIEF
ncbi:MAG: TonB-dependent receptor [Calditrichaeota bacterium]|nr:TonB-dependent receptor [Calditrichota bacterium]